METARQIIVHYYLFASGVIFACMSAVFLSVGGLGWLHLIRHDEYLIHDHIIWIMGVGMAVLAYCLLTEVFEEDDAHEIVPSVDLTGTVQAFES